MIHTVLTALCVDKQGDDFLFTRKDGSHMLDMRHTWENACVHAGVGEVVCANPECAEPKTVTKCPKCGSRDFKYTGLLVHDLRRTGARNLRRAGVPESMAMEIGGWLTASVFRRYAITDRADHKQAMEKLEQDKKVRRAAFGHNLVTVPKKSLSGEAPASVESVN